MSNGCNSLVDSRLPHIDGLRGVAILLVLLTHVWVFNGAPAYALHVGGRSIVLAAVVAVGHVGVNLFLVLSGFCLAWPFMRDPTYLNRMTATRFWLRRFRRVAPAYYMSIILLLALTTAFDRLARRPGVGSVDWLTIWPHLLFVHNLSVRHVSTINGSYWSLALEFQLYLVFPLFLEAMRRWGPWRVLGAVLAAQLAYRVYLDAVVPGAELNEFQFVFNKAVPGRMLDFVSGMSAAHLVARGSWRAGLMATVAGVALLAAFALGYSGLAAPAWQDVGWSIGFAALVCTASRIGGICNCVFRWRPLVLLGLCSYSVYLLHQPLVERAAFLTLKVMRPGKAFLFGVAILPLIIGACAAFYLVCEKRFLDYFARKDAARQRSATPAPTPTPTASIEPVPEGVAG